MFPTGEFESRFREILDMLDGICAQLNGGARESIEELNAEFEDALFMLSDIDPNDEEGWEELRDAMAEFRQLCADYRKLAGQEPSIRAPIERLEMLAAMVEGNLK